MSYSVTHRLLRDNLLPLSIQGWYGTLNTPVRDAFQAHYRGTPGVLADSSPDEAVDGTVTGWMWTPHIEQSCRRCL